jgi:exodeoxyribonuclease-3
MPNISMTRIVTWNVNSLRVRLPQVLEWINTHHPDILALQETKLLDENFPVYEIKDAGYEVVYSGQKTYNGVAILSRHKADEIVKDIPGLEDSQRRVVFATYNKLRVLNVYVPNGENVESEKYQYKLNWLKKLTAYVKQQLKSYPYLVILGDFNIAPDSRDVYDPEVWQGQVLFSDPERAALKTLLDTGLCDTFRRFEQDEKQYSWWDYRMMAFRRNRGLRIDHILASNALGDLCTSCTIDKEPRRWERPSDHAPVIAEFTI